VRLALSVYSVASLAMRGAMGLWNWLEALFSMTSRCISSFSIRIDTVTKLLMRTATLTCAEPGDGQDG
jgi:hypothetical protein